MYIHTTTYSACPTGGPTIQAKSAQLVDGEAATLDSGCYTDIGTKSVKVEE